MVATLRVMGGYAIVRLHAIRSAAAMSIARGLTRGKGVPIAMPQRAAMKKHLRQTRTRTLRNRRRKRAIKQSVRQVMDAARAGDAEAAQIALIDAQKALDKAAQRGVVHRHTAARRKSRLVARVRRLLAQE